MSTAVVSGRIDADLKVQVDAIVRNAGSSISEVINNVWLTIAQTGELPADNLRTDGFAEQRARFEAFEGWLAALPEPNPAYIHMSDEEILATKVDRYA